MNFPNPFAPLREKESKEYGLQYARYIAEQWMTTGRYRDRNVVYAENDAYCENRVDITRFKRIMGMDESELWTGMDFTYVPIVSKFVNVVKGSLQDGVLKTTCRAVDAVSSEERRRFRERMERDMLTLPLMEAVTEATGRDFMPKGEVAESDEEIELYMQLKYKQPREIAGELIIERVEALNGMEELQDRMKEDLLRYGCSFLRVMPDPDYGVRVERCRPHDMVWSYDTRDSRTTKGCYYYGVLETYHAPEVLRMGEGEITEEDLQRYAGGMEYVPHRGDWNPERLVNVLYFCFKTTVEDVWKRKRNNMIEKEEGFQLPRESRSRVVGGRREVWFEGYHIPGTDLLFGYRMMRDMVRRSGNILQVMPPFIGYTLTTPPLVSLLRPYSDDAQMAVLKLRHLILSARPKGYNIDIDALQSVDIGGGVLQPIEVIRIFNQTGNLLYSSRSFDDTATGSRVLSEISGTLGTDIGQLITYYNNALNMCYEVTGVNRVRDGSAPTANTLLGVSEMALSQSNSATRLYLQAVEEMRRQLGEVILNRCQQMTLYGEDLCGEVCDIFLDKRDEVRREFLSCHRYNFDVIVEEGATVEERSRMAQNVQNAVQSGQITLSDALEIGEIGNMKLAGEYLRMMIERRQRDAEARQVAVRRAEIEAETEAELRKEQAGVARFEAETRLIIAREQAERERRMAEIEKEAEAKLLLMDREYAYKMRLAGMEVDATRSLTEFKEAEKGRRIDRTSTAQSRMIAQRRYNTSPIDFTALNEEKAVANPPRYEITDTEEARQHFSVPNQ